MLSLSLPRSLFRRGVSSPPPAGHGSDFGAALGTELVAIEAPAGAAIAPGCVALLVDQAGRGRRVTTVTTVKAVNAGRLAPAAGEQAWLLHPGPYHFTVRPCASAFELGLRLALVIDFDPRAVQQRFDLYLASEVRCGSLSAAALGAAIEASLQRALEQGPLALPPCATLAEWNAFRAGLDRLLYVRFGVVVDECLPVDLGSEADFAALLRDRAAQDDDTVAPAGDAAPAPAHKASVAAPGRLSAPPAPLTDAQALRRLFLELPALMCALRAALPAVAGEVFQRQQALLRRLDGACLAVTTMPALTLAAPGVLLDDASQARRSDHARRACATLDEAWSLLARLGCSAANSAAHSAAHSADLLIDDAERLVANLEADLAERRASAPPAPARCALEST